MLSVLLFPAFAVLSGAAQLADRMERDGHPEAAKLLQQALAHDDPLAQKLEAFAQAMQHKVDSAEAMGKEAADWIKHDVAVGSLYMKEAAAEVGRAELGTAKSLQGLARPSSFAQTGGFTVGNDLPVDSVLADTQPLGLDRLADQETSMAQFDQSLQLGGLEPDEFGLSAAGGPLGDYDPEGKPGASLLGATAYDYNGDATPSLDSLTNQLVEDAAQSDEQMREAGFTPSSLAQTGEPDDNAQETEDADNAEIEKVAKKPVRPVSVKLTGKAAQDAQDLGVPVPEIEVVKFPFSDRFMREKEQVDEKLEQDAADDRETVTATSRMTEEQAVLNKKREHEAIQKEASKHKRMLSDRVKEDESALLKDLTNTAVANNADLKGYSLEDTIKAAFGGGHAKLADEERALAKHAAQERQRADEDSSFVQVLPDGHMRTQ